MEFTTRVKIYLSQEEREILQKARKVLSITNYYCGENCADCPLFPAAECEIERGRRALDRILNNSGIA